MTHVGYLVAGYGITFGSLGAYAAWVVRRRQALSAELGAADDAAGPSRP